MDNCFPAGLLFYPEPGASRCYTHTVSPAKCLITMSKVKVKVKVNFTLAQTTKAQWWGRGTSLLFF
jgi:hypothetical protein